MAKEMLSSDRVNYLIWRYLLESDYPEAAVHLQKEWNLEDPQRLSFAPHVPDRALVSLVNRGLLYHAVERDAIQSAAGDSGSVPGFFGPLTAAAPDPEDLETTRKRHIDSEALQPHNIEPPIKRPRLSNGYENGFESAAMDVDEEPIANVNANGNGNAYPSPEQAPSPVAVTVGPEQEMQAEKVIELGPETMFLELSDEAANSSSSARSPVLLHCEWNPRDASVLAAAGTEALARLWTLSRAPLEAGNMQLDPVLPPHLNLLDESVPPSTLVTCLAWSSDGASLAVSSEPVDDGTARIDFYTADGTSYGIFHAFKSPVVSLQWNLDNTACLALTPDIEESGVSLTVMIPDSQDCIRYSFPLRQSFIDQPPAAAWTSNEEFVICGGETLVAFHCVGDTITPARKFETREGHALSRITYDWRSRLLATASDTGIIDVWDQSGQCHSFNAHQGTISSLLWQPLQMLSAVADDNERLLVSAGEDGAISIWNARSSETKSRCSMTMDSAVVSLAFTPDGAFIAGATTERILIWKVDDPHIPRASWTRETDLGWQTPQSSESAPEEDQHCLCWDANGQKLAYGVNSQLAVISFRR